MRTVANNSATIIRPDLGPELLALTQRRLDELDRLKDVAYDRLGMISRATALLSPDDRFRTMVAPSGAGVELDRLLRSIRQIMVLEFEMRGLFEAPDRREAGRKLRLVKSDRPGFVPPKLDNPLGDLDRLEDLLDIRTDYRNGPLDEVVGSIRKIVGAEAPTDDPFASPAEMAPEAVAPATPPRGPEYYMRSKPAEPKPVSAQDAPSMKAAEFAITRLDGKGFRTPSKARMKKRRQGRGPPK